MPLTILLNGQRRTFEDAAHLSLMELVIELGFQADRVAIEHNAVIVSRNRWPETYLADNERVEIVHFVGGGAPVRSSRRRSHRSP